MRKFMFITAVCVIFDQKVNWLSKNSTVFPYKILEYLQVSFACRYHPMTSTKANSKLNSLSYL